MPLMNGEPKARLEQSFWEQLEHRYPLTYWWWDAESGFDKGLFPEWSRPAFEQEAVQWRRLSQETMKFGDDETVHWGRFARWVATRLSSGSFQDAAEPLRHANLVLTLVALLDPTEQLYPRQPLLVSLTEWLGNVSDVGVQGFWRRVRLHAEAARLEREVEILGQKSESHAQAQSAQEAITNYVQAAIAQTTGFAEPAPWATTAHVSVGSWRCMRQAMARQRPLVLDRPRNAGEVLSPKDSQVPRLQEVIVPGLTQWWVRPGRDIDVLYHGDTQDVSLFVAVMLALWHQSSQVSRLTWALTHPPHIEGGLMTVMALLEDLWPNWEPVQSHQLAQRLQQRQALAIVDAWLWLEGADPMDALNWLSRFMPRDEAIAMIPWMKSQPGYYVMAHRAFEVLMDVDRRRNWEHRVFKNGPIMPEELFLSPGQTPSPHDER